MAEVTNTSKQNEKAAAVMKHIIDCARTDNFFDVFGLSPSSVFSDVATRFRELSKTVHPDRNPECPELANRAFSELKRCRDALDNPVIFAGYSDAYRLGFKRPFSSIANTKQERVCVVSPKMMSRPNRIFVNSNNVQQFIACSAGGFFAKSL